MEHPGEIWQELDFNGERLEGGITPGADDSAVKLYYGVAVMLYRFKDGMVEYLFQHRSKHLAGNPDKWDVSAGGHTNLNEHRIDAILREAKEEIGVSLQKEKLELAAGYLRHEQRVFVELYFYNFDGNDNAFSFNDREVEEVAWIKYSDLAEFWPKLKVQVRDDEIFKHYLEVWNKKTLAKYENH